MKASRFITTPPNLSNIENSTAKFQNLVVGAGPAGYAVVSALLDAGSRSTLWVDPAFQSGRLLSYLDVPSNTKAKLFAKYATTPSCASAASETAMEGLKVKGMFATLAAVIKGSSRHCLACAGQGSRKGLPAWRSSAHGCEACRRSSATSC